MLCAVPPANFRDHLPPGAPLLVPWKGASTGARAHVSVSASARAMCSLRVDDADVCACDRGPSVICLCGGLVRVGTGLVQIGVHKNSGGKLYTRVSGMTVSVGPF
jgi:hypothetical protein